MTLFGFLLYFKKDENYYLELYINNEISLSCSLEDAIKTLVHDSRGKLIIGNDAVKIREYSSNVTGIYGRIYIQVFL